MAGGNEIEAILTDFGGVVLSHSTRWGVEKLVELADVDGEAVLAMLEGAKDASHAMHLGQITALDFFDSTFSPAWPNVTREQFHEAWNAMVGEDHPQVRAAYEALPPEIPLYTLSNVGRTHLEFLRDHWLLKRSRRFFGSCEIGLAKPDPAVFEYVLREIDLPGEAVLFFDDSWC